MARGILDADGNLRQGISRRFGKLTVLSGAGVRNQKSLVLCRCDCGREKIVYYKDLRSGNTRSCGCVQREKLGALNRTHGKTSTPEYAIWCAIIARCFNPNYKRFSGYGGRGITLCDRWRNSFEAFLSDMGTRPSPQHSIDRFPDNDGNYEPGNCRWATRREQSRNTRRTRMLTFRGQTKCLSDWAAELGVSYLMILKRLKRGWTIEMALSVPPNGRKLISAP